MKNSKKYFIGRPIENGRIVMVGKLHKNVQGAIDSINTTLLGWAFGKIGIDIFVYAESEFLHTSKTIRGIEYTI